MIYANKFNLTGTDKQNTLIVNALNKIKFPWNRLNFPRGTAEIGWKDLNNGQFLNNPNIDAIEGVLYSRDYIFGVMYPSNGNIYIDKWLGEHRPDLAESTVSAEIAHDVDYFLPLTNQQKTQIMALMHPNGTDNHTWWEKVSYSKEYYSLVAESFMQVFTLSYSDIPFNANNFTHSITAAQAPQVRDIIGIQRTDSVNTPPPVLPVIRYKRIGRSKFYHTLSHYPGMGTIITDIRGLTPCRTCVRDLKN